MKRSLLLLLFLASLVFSQVKAQAPIPNGNFEMWDDFTTYMNPTQWDTPNPETSLVGITVVSQESVDVYDGAFSARLETKTVISFIAPGLLTLGEFSVDFVTTEITIEGGVPYTDMPEKLTGYYKYAPVDNDSWFITAIFTKWNTTTSETDTVGGATFVGSSATDEWLLFASDIIWWAGIAPDSMNIIVASSDIDVPQPGSVLLLDKTGFDDGVGFDETSLENSINFFHNQRDNQLNLQYNFDASRNVEVIIYNVMGQQLMNISELSVQNYTQTIHLDDLKSGIYMVEVNDGKEKLVKKIIL